jgi:hypothetical protein
VRIRPTPSGDLLLAFAGGVRYGSRLLDYEHVGGTNYCNLFCLPTVCDVNPNGTYMEAENRSVDVNAGVTYGFAGIATSTSGYLGTGYVSSATTNQNQLDFSDVNAHPGSYQRYDYDALPTTGLYNLWMRGYAVDGAADSIHRLDGIAVDR